MRNDKERASDTGADNVANSQFGGVTKNTHDRIFVDGGNASHYEYKPKGEPPGSDEYVVAWIEPGAPGWHNSEKGPCPVCGCEEVNSRGLWTCGCPAPAQPAPQRQEDAR